MLTKNQIDFARVRYFLFFGLIFILLVAFLYLIKPFIYAIFWAAVISILLHPMHRFISKYIDLPSVSSLISLILVIVIIFLPLTLFGYLLIQQSVQLYLSFSDSADVISNVQGFASWLQNTPLAPYIQEITEQWTAYAASAAKTVSIFLFQNIKSITQNSVRFIFMLFIMLYALYFFFKDGKKITNYLSFISPLGNNYEKMFYEKFRDTALATLKTTIIIGGIQGTLGGLLFWVTGVKGAFIWGVLMVLLSMIPALGSFIIWLPAAIIMIATGNTWEGILILIIGTFVISTIDNLLRPILVGKGTAMHPLIVLLTTLGGIVLFGISGFVIGPIIASLLLAVMSIYSHYYKTELSDN